MLKTRPQSLPLFRTKTKANLCREEMIRDLPLDHDIMSALTITEFFPREHTGLDSVEKSC